MSFCISNQRDGVTEMRSCFFDNPVGLLHVELIKFSLMKVII